jgi:hypothetical protein
MGKKTQGINQVANNTLDPMQVGNERNDGSDELSTSNNDDSSVDYNI